MQNDVYRYTQTAGAVQKSTVLRKTYALLGISFIPCALGAFISSRAGINLYAMFGNRWIAFGAVLAFFYGMCYLIERNRHSNAGAALLMVFTFGMGVLVSPLLQYSLSFGNGAQIVGTAAVMTAAVFFTMSALARRTKADMNSLGRFLMVGVVVLIVGMVANMFLQLPALSLALSAAFVVFSSLVIMWQTRTVIDGGETSHISAALTIFISIYNIFSSLLNILLSVAGED
ncbi:Bax inhibitor-1/YccA family protein [Neisseria musculi]|uniref:Inhibitor of apoptosis-promoting Bax1 family protein n=1 Tax=Neisseria musculi TaxID=1815583 RepID=A0A7H1M9D6_9NEIS|nr:Bax inhibitor-1/YccA family protein [Neisseria musculi]QNT58251.1 inhibitor of apoptosis-promoting Bax1 family protein [Neisseria musculi]